ncbi:MAG: hypothetical protein ACRCTU_03485 [Zoogloea sp.]|uniref:hypothetical protein n=1 Tax=Zoogloea sp. TaxID=49181 RepID=UPI003F2D08F3
MNILSRLFGKVERQVADPLFGLLRQKNRCWDGEVAWPYGGHNVYLSVCWAPDEPTQVDRDVYQALCENYLRLLPAIRQSLFELWGPVHPDAKWDGPRPSSPQELFNMLELGGLFIEQGSRVELHYNFAGDTWPDGMFTVAIQGNTVEPVAFDD